MRVSKHPILGDYGADKKSVTITVNGQPMEALEGEPIAAALMANGIRAFRKTPICTIRAVYSVRLAGAPTVH